MTERSPGAGKGHHTTTKETYAGCGLRQERMCWLCLISCRVHGAGHISYCSEQSPGEPDSQSKEMKGLCHHGSFVALFILFLTFVSSFSHAFFGLRYSHHPFLTSTNTYGQICSLKKKRKKKSAPTITDFTGILILKLSPSFLSPLHCG